VAFNLTACDKMTPKDPLPRHQALKAFDPHRKEFACTYEADAVPPIDRQAEAWHQEALYVTRAGLWPNQRDWKKAEQLWTQAAERKHWKAMMNLASLYETGQGEGALAVPEDSYRAIDIVEEAMRLGIPAAYDKMGNYHS
ncbi:sel1 repeat family protein, partial [Halomonas sp. ND22Bw]|uniref:sel1 repeat family protein n=1 Tax=Halomonas sp. ND22Bw TaxID=2054178 RepID=UPI000D2CAF9C